MSARIEDLEPQTKSMCLRFLHDCSLAGHEPRVTHTLRTLDEQAHLYAKGRTLPGAVVTNARPGSSPHNWAAAFDIAFPGPEPYAETHPWAAVGAIGKAVGLVWGGDFKHLVDRPHFEHPAWRSFRAAHAEAPGVTD